MADKRCFNRQRCRIYAVLLRDSSLNRVVAKPMFQLVLPAGLFQLRARRPSCAPLLQLPNRRSTEQEARTKTSAYTPVKFQSIIVLSGGISPRPPETPYGVPDESRRVAKPMLQWVSPAGSSQLRARRPSSAPSAQLPNRRSTVV